MKTKLFTNILPVTMLTAIVLLTVFSCKPKEPEVNTHEEAYGDVLLKKTDMNGSIIYMPVFFAGGEGILGGESKVTTPEGEVITLEEFWAGPGILTATGEARSSFDFFGTYTFTLKFEDGYVKEVTDVLENVEIDIPYITGYSRIDEPEQIIVRWMQVENADLYCVKITDLDMANNKPYFKMAQLPTDINSYTINFDGSEGWLRPVDELERGQKYWLVVAAKKVEEGAEVSGMSHDFQTSSCYKIQFVY